MNDMILDLNLRALVPPADAVKFAPLSLQQVLAQGDELFRGNPNLTATDTERAKRLAALIVIKAPKANAAFFDTNPVAPGRARRPPQAVTISIELLAALYAEYIRGKLTPELVHRKVWSLLPA